MININQWLWQDKEITQSTNDDAVAYSAEQTKENFIISSRRQTKGRGRRGRNWISLEGNLFFSQGLKFNISQVGQLTILCSVSLFETIKELISVQHQVSIKWPNDLLIDNQKVSGMLLEKGHNGYIIIGIGVNIKAAPTENEMLYPVSNLADNGINIDRLEFLRSYIANFDNNYQILQKTGFAEIKSKWLKAVQGLGKKILVRTEQEHIEGTFRGIGENGELLLETKEGLRRIYAGDVFYI